MARVEEAYGERDQTVDAKGNVTEIEIPYLVFEVSDEDAALSGLCALIDDGLKA